MVLTTSAAQAWPPSATWEQVRGLMTAAAVVVVVVIAAVILVVGGGADKDW